MLNSTGLVGQSSKQPRALVQGFGRSVRRLSGFLRLVVGISFGTQGVQRPQRTQTRIFAMTADEAQANLDTMTGTIFVFGIPAIVLFDSRSSRSLLTTTFALDADQKLASLKNKLVVSTLLGEQILRTSVFKGCEVLVEGVVLKSNLIPLEMFDFDVILDMDWLSNHHALMDCFTKMILFKKLGYLDLKFESDRRILSTCVISALEARRLLHKGCEAYLAHVIDKSSSEVIVESVPIVCEFFDVFPEDLPSLLPDRELEF